MSNIVVVENGMSLGRMLSVFLMDEGYDTAMVRRPREVEGLLRASPAAVILLLLDEGSELEAERKAAYISAWRGLAPAIRVVEISEEPPMPPVAVVSREAVPDFYVSVPFEVEDIVVVIDELLTAGERNGAGNASPAAN